MRKDVFRKGLVLGIILLFVGAGVVPNVVGDSEEIYIEPDICLDKSKLPIMKLALFHIENNEQYKILSEMIRLIEKNDKIDSNDIKQIIKDLDISTFGIGVGYLHAKGSVDYGSGAPIICLPGYFLYNLLNFYVGPIGIATWSFPNGYCEINFRDRINGANSGLVIGGIGSIMVWHLGERAYEFRGFFSLIMVT